MKIQRLPALAFLFFFCFSSAQKLEYATMLIPQELKENANAVIRSSEQRYVIHSQNSLTIYTKTACTVLNEYGLRNLHTSRSYDKTTRIGKLEARVYDNMGNEIKLFRKKDFKDVSLADGFSLFRDDRVLYLDYTPVAYPFTMVVESEESTSNTAQIAAWSALSGYYASTEKDAISIEYPDDLGFSYKMSNFNAGSVIEKSESPGRLSLVARKLPAIKGEAESPDFYKIAPVVYFRLDKFSLEGVAGTAKDWKEFGKWYYDQLLAGTDELPAETVQAAKRLVGDERDPVKVARILYGYMQNKTRYVSIQVGIGGYKPMNAADVDKLGYGDCKALSNYTRALLKAVGVPSYFTLVYAGSGSRRSLQPDFASPQGNHAILALPVDDGYVWMECTNQIIPFGFQGKFTDGRDVLVIKPEGGEIVHTRQLNERDNSEIAKGEFSIAADGSFTGTVSIVSSGGYYDDRYANERLSARDQEKWYKDYFSHISGLKIEKIEFGNDRESIRFSESIRLSAPNFASVGGNRLMFPVNAFHRFGDTPTRYRNRQNPVSVERGFLEQDEVTVNIPDGFEVEALPSDVDEKSAYGEYSATVERKSANSLVYKRSLLIRDGYYPSNQYEAYRQFCEKIEKFDAAKVVLVKKT